MADPIERERVKKFDERLRSESRYTREGTGRRQLRESGEQTLPGMDDQSPEDGEQVALLSGELYLHPSLKPIGEADLGTSDSNQLDLFATDECEGMCGV